MENAEYKREVKVFANFKVQQVNARFVWAIYCNIAWAFTKIGSISIFIKTDIFILELEVWFVPSANKSPVNFEFSKYYKLFLSGNHLIEGSSGSYFKPKMMKDVKSLIESLSYNKGDVSEYRSKLVKEFIESKKQQTDVSSIQAIN